MNLRLFRDVKENSREETKLNRVGQDKILPFLL